MSDWRSTGENSGQREQSAQEILRLGIQPELLGEMEPEQARIVISGLAKLLATQVHPDTAGHNATILGLTTGDITGIEARTKALPDEVLADILTGYSADSVVSLARLERASAEQTRDSVLATNESLAVTLLEGPESITAKLKASLLIYNTDIAGNPGSKSPDELQRLSVQEALVVDIQNGHVITAYKVPAQKGLVSTLSTGGQAYLNQLRPDLSGEEVTAYLPENNDVELPPGWYSLQTAVSKSNRKKRVSAYRRYSVADDERVEVEELIGARLIGRYIGNRSGGPIAGVLDQDSQADKASAQRAGYSAASRLLTPLGMSQVAYMLSRGIIRPLGSVDEVTDTGANYVFYSSGSGVGFVLNETSGGQDT